MLNSKGKRTLKKFEFKKELVSSLNLNQLNSIQGGENTVVPSFTFLCARKYSELLGCPDGSTELTECDTCSTP